MERYLIAKSEYRTYKLIRMKNVLMKDPWNIPVMEKVIILIYMDIKKRVKAKSAFAFFYVVIQARPLWALYASNPIT